MRISLPTATSEKCSTMRTEASKNYTSSLYFVPNSCTSQKRFARKNNTSAQKKANKTQMESNPSIKNFERKNSQKNVKEDQKNVISPSYIKLNHLLASESRPIQNKSLTQLKTISKSFREYNNKENTIFDQEKTMKISEQKRSSRYSHDSRRSQDSLRKGFMVKNSMAVLETELDLKEKEIVKLEDQRRKFRNMYQDLKRKHGTQKQEFEGFKKTHTQTKKQLNQKIKKLEEEVKKQQKINETIQKTMKKKVDELKTCERQKENILRQLNLYIERKVPKNIRDLQSWKEISLEQRLEELKKELGRSKGDIELQMQEFIKNLQKQNNVIKQQLSKIQIANRLLMQKAADSDKYLQAYTTTKSECQKNRAILKSVREECDYLRKENVRMKKELNTMNSNSKKQQKIGPIAHLRVPSQTQSLSFSVYSRE